MINKVLLMEFFKDDDIKLVDKDFYIKSQMKNDVIKYITILEEENEIYKSRCERAIEYIKEEAGYDEEIRSCCSDLLYSDCDKLIELLSGDEE